MNIDTENLIKIIPYTLYNKFYYLLVFKNQESLSFNKQKNQDKLKNIFEKLNKKIDLLETTSYNKFLDFEELEEEYCKIFNIKDYNNEEYSKEEFIEILEKKFKNVDLIISFLKDDHRESINYTEDLIYEYLENNVLSIHSITILRELIACCVIGF